MNIKNRKKWTDEDLRTLATLSKNHSAEYIASVLKRSTNAIILKAQRSGLLDGNKRFYPKQHIKPPKLKGTIGMWRIHPTQPNYYVSDTGVIWNARLGKEVAQFQKNNGHWVVKVVYDGKSKEVKVSRLVAETWLNLKNGQSVAHKNRNKKNNDISNLIVTSKSSLGKATGHLSKAKKVALYIDGIQAKVYRSIRQAALDNGVSYQTINDYLEGKVKKSQHGKDFRFYQKALRPKE